MANKLEVRERILEIADKLFRKQGYKQTGINQIIKEAEVAKASLYYHFPSKDDLCLAYLHERNTIWFEEFYEYLKDKDDKISASFDYLKLNNTNSDYRGCSFLNMLSETNTYNEGIFNELQNHKNKLQDFFYVQLNQRDKEFAYLIYTLFESAIIESQLYRTQLPVDRIKSMVLDLIEKRDKI